MVNDKCHRLQVNNKCHRRMVNEKSHRLRNCSCRISIKQNNHKCTEDIISVYSLSGLCSVSETRFQLPQFLHSWIERGINSVSWIPISKLSQVIIQFQDSGFSCCGWSSIRICKYAYLICHSRQLRLEPSHTNSMFFSFGMPLLPAQTRAMAYLFGNLLFWYAAHVGAGTLPGIVIWNFSYIVCFCNRFCGMSRHIQLKICKFRMP